jgi:hypothetical protein
LRKRCLILLNCPVFSFAFSFHALPSLFARTLVNITSGQDNTII